MYGKLNPEGKEQLALPKGLTIERVLTCKLRGDDLYFVAEIVDKEIFFPLGTRLGVVAEQNVVETQAKEFL